MAELRFAKLNQNWNAEPNAPDPEVEVHGTDVLLTFYVNPFLYDRFRDGDSGILRFKDCSRFRLGETNDEGWYRGQCRYTAHAPAWGEFYELSGNDPTSDDGLKWSRIRGQFGTLRHFLFYLRDETFECFASDWLFEPVSKNALSQAT